MTTISPSQTAIPAGWYRDPLGLPQYRWWDGFSWTNRILEDAPVYDSGMSTFGQAPVYSRRSAVA